MNAIILAGGRSRRFGSDKASIRIGGATLLEREINVLRPLFKKIIIVTNNLPNPSLRGVKRRLVLRSPKLLRSSFMGVGGSNLILVKDIIKDCGPLGGVYSGLKASDTHHNFVVACDMPFLNQDLIRFMLNNVMDYDIVIFHKKEKVQPLHAIYSKNCIKPIEEELRKGNLRIRDFFKFVKVKMLPEERVARLDPGGLAFVNINTKKDFEKHKGVLIHGSDQV